MDFQNFATNSTVIFITYMGILGLIMGSFLNVVIYRLPIILEEQLHIEYAKWMNQKPKAQTILSLWSPRSFCVHCKSKIAFFLNIPVLSYFMLGGRSHCCKRKISLIYPLVELMTALLAALFAYQFAASIKFIFAFLFLIFLLPLIFIDIQKRYLPNQLTMPLLWIGLLMNTMEIFATLTDAVYGAVVGYVICYTLAFLFKLMRKKEGLGEGDFKLVAAFGAWFGWQNLPFIIFIATLIGIVCALNLIFLKKLKPSNMIPFGPFLGISSLIFLFLDNQTLYHALW